MRDWDGWMDGWMVCRLELNCIDDPYTKFIMYGKVPILCLLSTFDSKDVCPLGISLSPSLCHSRDYLAIVQGFV